MRPAFAAPEAEAVEQERQHSFAVAIIGRHTDVADDPKNIRGVDVASHMPRGGGRCQCRRQAALCGDELRIAMQPASERLARVVLCRQQPVRLALIDDSGPTGGFTSESGPMPW